MAETRRVLSIVVLGASFLLLFLFFHEQVFIDEECFTAFFIDFPSLIDLFLMRIGILKEELRVVRPSFIARWLLHSPPPCAAARFDTDADVTDPL